MANAPRDQVVRPLPILTVPPPMTLVRIILKSFVFFTNAFFTTAAFQTHARETRSRDDGR